MIVIVIAHCLIKFLTLRVIVPVITQRSASKPLLNKNCYHGTCLSYWNKILRIVMMPRKHF